jgi:hypothetical protein
MCKAFAFRFSAEATLDTNLIETVDSQVDIGDGVAGFGWIGSTNKAMAHGPRHHEVASSGIPGKVALSEIKTTIRHSMLSRPVCSNLFQVLVSKRSSPRCQKAKALVDALSVNHSSKAPV